MSNCLDPTSANRRYPRYAVQIVDSGETLAGSSALATGQVSDGLAAMIPSIRYPDLPAITAYERTSGDANPSALSFWRHMVERHRGRWP